MLDDNQMKDVIGSGAYNPGDVTFLLNPVSIKPTDVAEKERLIQSGEAHYSEMISEERRPDARYTELFEGAEETGAPRIAAEMVRIAATIRDMIARGVLPKQITLCSLVRAGVPFGVILQRELKAIGVDTAHFGISIIRDKGLDEVAMRHIVSERGIDGILFVDGWTGKGAITNELRSAWRRLAGRDPFLIVQADPCGRADLSGSFDDWLIPSGIMGGNVSGLVSRSILNDEILAAGTFHGCMRLDHMNDIDISLSHVDKITALAEPLRDGAKPLAPLPGEAWKNRVLADTTINRVARTYKIRNRNRIKPGIAEATRAVLRRKPHLVVLRNTTDPDLSALLHLCCNDGVDMLVDPKLTGPYRAITIIEKTS
ncbi:MAG: cysteine protease StiP domain-containing protein [Roseibium sp.]|uniref:cysteine protease StiP domain-containing protein n=1 Tax=Roseibium sp. TaxID=1936156 RepID=UPI0032970C3C